MRQNRVGMGFDVHKFKPGNGLPVCGVFISDTLGVEAHSDGDVGIHALMDSILGAMGEGDIGVYFPPSDSKYKDADSKKLLAEVLLVVKKLNYRIINVDITILCQQPKINPWRNAMKECIAEILEISEDRVGIKATTTEGLGFLGRIEGIAAQAICLLEKGSED
jgi:2-C-methyl-D-erythritol 2,4-cyclodiphosphate synthase